MHVSGLPVSPVTSTNVQGVPDCESPRNSDPNNWSMRSPFMFEQSSVSASLALANVKCPLLGASFFDKTNSPWPNFL